MKEKTGYTQVFFLKSNKDCTFYKYLSHSNIKSFFSIGFFFFCFSLMKDLTICDMHLILLCNAVFSSKLKRTNRFSARRSILWMGSV